MKKQLLFFSLSIIFSKSIVAQAIGLQACWDKQVKPVQQNYLQLNYTETLNELYHSPQPWDQLNYTGKGTVHYNLSDFLKHDTLKRGQRTYFSKTQYNDSTLFFLDYGDKEISTIAKSRFAERYLLSPRYTPSFLINYAFSQQNFRVDKRPNKSHLVYLGNIQKTEVRIFINRADSLVSTITLRSHDDLHGDVMESYIYSDYTRSGDLFYPQTIRISKINGHVNDEVKLLKASFVNKIPSLFETPLGYALKEDEVEKPIIKTEKYSDHIYFIDLAHASSRVVLVEFDGFFLAAEAPLNSENAELIIAEAKKIAPKKPIRYFVFGHHHPHYLGGMRAFISRGAKVLTVESNKDYLKYLTGASHRIKPDTLQKHPKPLKLEIIKDSLTITDNKYVMKIYFMGEKSGHTKDYLVYYFPQEKMLFEDDLVWIKKEGEIGKASERQLGVYNLIKDKQLDVKTVVQSWGISSNDYKTVIPFEDLEKSVNVQ